MYIRVLAHTVPSEDKVSPDPDCLGGDGFGGSTSSSSSKSVVSVPVDVTGDGPTSFGLN